MGLGGSWCCARTTPAPSARTIIIQIWIRPVQTRTASVSIITTTVARLASAPTNGAVTVRGTMIEKCPTAGCWFMLQDNTGRVRVDLKAAGFVVTDVPTGGTVCVTGRLRREDEEPVVVASGARFE